tara:strand:- start:926 stop:1993 length:1068 start_codon:yes stop_codon:yes gene_type:complete
MTKRNIIVTGAGAPGIKGTLFALTHAETGGDFRITGIDIADDVPGKNLVDSFYKVPSPEDPNYKEAILNIIEKENISLIVPQTTREIAFYSQQKSYFEDRDIRIMVSSAKSIEISNNKFDTLSTMDGLGFPVSKYFLTKSEDALIQAVKELGYPEKPVVIKAPVSNGMRGLRILKAKTWNLERFLQEKPDGVEMTLEDFLKMINDGDAWPNLLVTEYLPGPEYSVDAFIGKEIQFAIPRLRKKIRSGISFHNEIVDLPELVKQTLIAARHMDLNYCIGFQFKEDINGSLKVLECNPRIQGTMVASLLSGVNMIAMGAKEALGEVQTKQPELTYGAEFIRYWGGIGIDNGNVKLFI